MSDLSNLFKSPPTKKSLSASPYQSPRTSFSLLGSRSQRCQISDFEEKVRLGVRKQVKAESMSEELNIFYQIQREILFVKIVVSGLFAALLYTSNIQGLLVISIMLLVVSQLLSTTVLPQQNSQLINTFNNAHYLIYFSAFYALLKWFTDTHHHQIHWPFTHIASTATVAHLIIRFYSPFFFVSARNIIGEAVRSKTIKGKMLIFPKYLIHRIKMAFGLAKYLAIMVSIFVLVSLLALAYFNQLSMQFFFLSNILVSVPIFIFLELFLDVLNFMNTVLSKDLKLSMIMKDKIPMFLNLLRLQYNPQNRKVQLQCLKSIYIKVYQLSDFLSNQTNKSLIYNTYMDIFNQFTVLQMERVSSLIMEFNTDAKINDKVVTLEKSIIQDMFILFRKIKARFTSEYKILNLIELLGSLNFLFLIINKIQKDNDQQEQDEVKVSGRIMHLVKTIKQRLGECTQRVSLSSYVRGQLTSLFLNFASYQFWIKDQQV